MKQVETSMSNQRVEIIQNIVHAFRNAANVHGMMQVAPEEFLTPLAMFVYLMQHNMLTQKINVAEGKDLVVLEAGPSMSEVDMSAWQTGKIATRGLIRSGVISDENIEAIYPTCQKLLRQFYNAHQLTEVFKAIKEAKFSAPEYLQLLLFAEQLMHESYTRESGEYSNPASMAEIVASLLGDVKKVYDPFMGVATFATELGKDVQFDGVELCSWVYGYAQIKLAIAGIKGERAWGDSLTIMPAQKYDAIISFPPLFEKNAGGIAFAELLVRLFEEHTTESGQMIMVAPMGFCFNSKLHDLRKRLTQLNYVDKILAFPGKYLYGTSLPCVLIHLSKRRPFDYTLVMNLGENFARQQGKRTEISVGDKFGDKDSYWYLYEDMGHRHVSNLEFESNDFDWSPLNYSFTQNAHMWRGTTPVKLREYITRIYPEVLKIDDPDLQIVNIRKMASPFSDIITDTSRSRRCIRITEPVVVVGYNKHCLLYPINGSEENPIYLNEREIVYRCDESVLPEYLGISFSIGILDEQMFDYGTTGLDRNRIIAKWLQTQEFGFAEKIDQLVIVEEERRLYTAKKIEQSNIREYVEQITNEYVQEVRSRKHNMRPYLREMKSSNDLAMLILKDATTLEQVQSQLLPLLQKQEQSRKSLSEIVDHLSQIEKFGKDEVLEYLPILKERIHYYSIASHIEFTLSEKFERTTDDENSTYGQYIICSAYDFTRMVDCIIDNAIKHGFEGKPDGHHVRIEVEQTYDELAIRFINDGLPFPEGFDINRYGLLAEKAGKYAGTGDGGHQVVSIAKHYGGYVTIESGIQQGTATAIIVHFPIHDKDEWDKMNMELKELDIE